VSCVKPLDGYRVVGGAVIIVKRGDRPPKNATTRIRLSIPCGKCIECKMEKARQWGMRCLHDAKMWPSNSYVTLTYADEHLPPGGSLCLRDVQLFLKRLRKARNSSVENPVRFFLGAEYGEENARPHYHALLFNCGFRDLVHFGKNKRGESLYTSRELSSLWSVDGSTLGHCTIGEVTFDSAVYCAKYALKKISGDRAVDHYTVFDENGECIERTPEFATMSRRPGIGAPYYAKYGMEVRDHDNIIINSKAVRPPRYYDTLTERAVSHDDLAILCRCKLCVNKRSRKLLSVKNAADNTPERLRVKEEISYRAAVKKERKL